MKNLFMMAIMILLVSCSKQDNPEPIVPNNPVILSTCSSAVWKYEVVLTTPVTAGVYEIQYRDAFGNMVNDLTLTSSWSHQFTMQYPGNPAGTFPMDLSIAYSFNGTVFNLTDSITINIYQDNQLVSSNNKEHYCWDDLNVCNTGPVTHNYQCN